MQMMEDIVKELTESATEFLSEISETKSILLRIEAESRLLGLCIPWDRWLAMGAHVLAFVRRMNNKERLPAIEPELFAEIPPDLVGLSRRVLTDEKHGWQADDTEAFLLAVHFEAIRVMQSEQSEA